MASTDAAWSAALRRAHGLATGNAADGLADDGTKRSEGEKIMEHCTTREPDPHAGSRFEEEAKESDVPCDACEGDCTPGSVVVLQGAVFCADCAFARAIELRGDEELWGGLSRHDQAEALEVISTGAILERTALLRRKS
jgi:hypothetical protein